MDKQLLQYEGSKKVMALVGALTLGQAISIIVQALYLSKAITMMFQGAAWTAAFSSLLIFFVAHLVRNFLQWGKERIAYRFADRTAYTLQQQLVEKTFELGPRSIGKHGSGNMITLVLEGIPQFKTYLQLYIPRFMSMGIIPLVLFLYVFKMDRLSGTILAVVLPILIVFLILLGITAQKQMDAQLDTYKLLSRHFVDSLRGLMTLKYLGRSKAHEKAISNVSNEYRIATNRTLRVAFLSTFALDFFTSLSIAIIAVELGVRLINGGIGLEPALAILILAPDYFAPVRELGNDFHATMDGKEAGEEINELLKEKTVEKTNLPSVPIWTASSQLAIRGIEKASDEGRAILKGLDFTASGHQKIGVVGTSGAGKSTLIDLLSGFTQPTAGEIVVDGTSVDHLSLPSWQDQLSYIPQHPTIFSSSVMDNVRFYEPRATREEVQEAIEMAGLDQLVNQFPKGLDEPIGQAGRTLSGGEEQRIALARLLLQNRSILLFDEPTAHLDIETEHEIKKTMLPLLNNKLVFFATHRLHWMQNMDTILVFEHGKIVETGTHEELVQKDGAYKKLMEAQRKGRKA